MNKNKLLLIDVDNDKLSIDVNPLTNNLNLVIEHISNGSAIQGMAVDLKPEQAEMLMIFLNYHYGKSWLKRIREYFKTLNEARKNGTIGL